MKLLIDNQDRTGTTDYTALLDAGSPPKIVRKLNHATRLSATIVGEEGTFAVPKSDAKVWMERADGSRWFTGWIECAPQQEFLGRGLRAGVVRYRIEAISDEMKLDRAPLAAGLAVAQANSAELVKRITDAAGDGEFDTSAVEDVGAVTAFAMKDGARWSEAVGEIAGTCRAVYRAEEGSVSLRPVGRVLHELSDSDGRFLPEALKIKQTARPISDWTTVGEVSAGAYVKDYFIGDGHTLRFPMSQQPFLRPSVTWLEEEYAELSPTKWTVMNSSAVYAQGGKLVVNGSSCGDGGLQLIAVEQVELCGCMVLEHGAIVVTAASEGVIGGLYDGAVAAERCVAGFRLSSAGGATTLQALIKGGATGMSIPIIYGHRYELTTRLYSSEVSRVSQRYRWSGGEESDATNRADARLVMELRDLDEGAPIPAAAVLCEAVVLDAPALVKYAVVNAKDMHATVAYTRVRHMPTAEVRTTSAADGGTKSRIVGMIGDGAECSVTTGPAVYFYAPFKPANGDQVVVRYRAAERAVARVFDPTAPNSAGAKMVEVTGPKARTKEDCAHAATALLKDSKATSWSGSYETWTDLLTNGEILPGDGVHVANKMRDVEFLAIVRQVESEVIDGANDRATVRFEFAEDGAEPIGVRAEAFRGSLDSTVKAVAVGATNAVASLAGAEALEITSTMVRIDAGADVPSGGGIEVRREGDFGWGEGNDRNLVARYTTRTFTVPRSTRSEDYYLRMYDEAVPRNYSPMTTLLHVDVKDDAI